MKPLILLILSIVPFTGRVHGMDNNQHLGAEAVAILTQTFPLRHKLLSIGKNIISLNGKINEKHKKAFKMHHDDVNQALDQVSKLCERVNADLITKEKSENIQKLLLEAQNTLKKAQKELSHYERSFSNHVKEINESKL